MFCLRVIVYTEYKFNVKNNVNQALNRVFLSLTNLFCKKLKKIILRVKKETKSIFQTFKLFSEITFFENEYIPRFLNSQFKKNEKFLFFLSSPQKCLKFQMQVKRSYANKSFKKRQKYTVSQLKLFTFIFKLKTLMILISFKTKKSYLPSGLIFVLLRKTVKKSLSSENNIPQSLQI